MAQSQHLFEKSALTTPLLDPTSDEKEENLSSVISYSTKDIMTPAI